MLRESAAKAIFCSILACLLLVQASLICPPAARALEGAAGTTATSPDGAEAVPDGRNQMALAAAPEIEALTEKIVRKEIELLRLSTNYRIESTRESRLRPWRFWLYNEAHFAINNAGIITLAAARWKYWQRPQLLPTDLAKAGPTLLLIGHSVLAGGVVFESCLDVLRRYNLRRRGLDGKTATRRVRELRSEIDRLIASRDTAVSADQSMADGDRQVLAAEGAVLKDIRDAAVLEFSKFNIRASRWRYGKDTAQAVALSAASTGGFIGSLMSLEAAACHRPHLAGASGLGFTLSGALIVLLPIVTRLSMITGGKMAQRNLKRRLPDLNAGAAEALNADRQKLWALLARSAVDDRSVLGTVARRARIYDLQGEIFEKQAVAARAERREENRELIERTLINAAIGGTKMGYGIQLMNAGFGFHANPNLPAVNVKLNFGGHTVAAALPKPKGGTNLFSKRVAQAATTFIPGTSIGMVDAAQARARGEWQIFRQHGGSQLAKRTLKERLNSLDKMEALLKGGAGT